jgi:hypothetical protein
MRQRFVSALFAFVVCLSAILCQQTPQRIQSLPDADITGLELYSGYLQLDSQHDGNMFYFFATSQNSPSEDPLLIWLQGGPGRNHGFVFLRFELTLG